MIVRDDHDIDRRHLAERQGHCLKALRSDEGGRRGARPPHGIGQNAYAVDFDQQGGVPEPRDPQAALRSALSTR